MTQAPAHRELDDYTSDRKKNDHEGQGDQGTAWAGPIAVWHAQMISGCVPRVYPMRTEPPNRQGSAVIEFPNDLEILLTREFDAPIELV